MNRTSYFVAGGSASRFALAQRAAATTKEKFRRGVEGGVAAAAFAALALVAALSVATPALAHNYYVESTPGVNEVLTTLPEQFVVTTNDNLLDLEGIDGGFFMVVTGPDGLYYGNGCIDVEGPSVMMPATLGPAGVYTLEWQVVSADGHSISDVVPFSWQPAAGQESTTQGSPTMPICGEEPVTVPEEPAPTESATDEDPTEPTENAAESATDEVSTNILWIGGAVIAVGLAIVVTLMLIRPKKKSDPEESPEESAEEAPEE